MSGLSLIFLLSAAGLLLASVIAVHVLVTRPLRRALTAIRRMTEGDFGGRLGGGQVGPLADVMPALDDLGGVFQRWAAAARDFERRYRLLFENNPTALFRARSDGRVLECNQAAVDVLGYDSVLDVITRNARTFYADPAAREELWERLENDGTLKDVQVVFRRKDGTDVPVLLNVVVAETGDDSSIYGQFLDLTGWRYAQSSEQRMS